MKLTYFLAITLAFAFTAPAIAADAKKDDNGGTEQKEKQICRTEEVTGSLTQKRRICMTAKEWREYTSKVQQDVDAYTKDAAKPQQSSGPFGG